jgi:2-isopropylmalate synthase
MKIKIAERTLCRENSLFSFKEKIEISRQFEKLGVDAIELPRIENVKTDTLLIKTIASFVKESIISVGAGMNAEGVEKAASALQTAKKPRIRVELPVSTVGMEYVCHKKANKMLELIKELVSLAKTKVEDVEFCAIDATRAEKAELKEFIIAAADMGANLITVCDSAALMMPDSFKEFINEIKVMLADKNVEIGVMCDNKNGLAAANAITAVTNGANTVKTDVSGEIVPVETFAGIIKNCGDNYDLTANVKYTELNRIIKQVNWITGNAKNEKSAVTVAETLDSGIKLDKNDEQSAVITAVMKLGYDLSVEDSSKVYEEFLRVAEKKNVGAKELDAIVASVALQVEPTYKLINYVINNGNIISSTAQITLEKAGEKMQGVSLGNGPVDAAFLAIEQIIGHHYELDDFQIQSVTEGKEAMAKALVKLRSGGKLYSGNGISTDIMGASIKAYLGAVNKIVYEEA